jgi:DHA1 family multidrug resistance protein-like MFS transporter
MIYFGTREKFTPADSKSAAEGPGFMTILFLPGFALSVLILFSVKFGSQVANPSFPLIVKDFIAPDDPLNSITGLVMGSAAISGAIAAAVLGYLSDRIGRRRILLLCCCGAGVAALGHYFAKNLLDLFVVRILHGFMMAGTLPAANAMIHSIVDRRSIGKAYGLSTSLSMLGTAIGPGLGGYLAMRAGIRVPFLVMAASQFLLVLIIMFCFHDRKKQVATLPGT